jgi:hypothetical protein
MLGYLTRILHVRRIHPSPYVHICTHCFLFGRTTVLDVRWICYVSTIQCQYTVRFRSFPHHERPRRYQTRTNGVVSGTFTLFSCVLYVRVCVRCGVVYTLVALFSRSLSLTHTHYLIYFSLTQHRFIFPTCSFSYYLIVYSWSC